MFSRKTQDTAGTALPNEWIQNISELLHKVYAEQCEALNKRFFTYGLSYPDEVLLSISILDKSDLSIIPVTYFISMDLLGKKIDEKTLHHLIDALGILINHYFQEKSWNDYVMNWETETFKGIEFSYKITRENIELSLEAEKLLNS